MTKTLYPLPDISVPSNFISVCVRVPDEPLHRAAFLGALLNLTYWFSWQRDEDKRAIEVAALWKEIWGEVSAAMGEGSDCGGGEELDVRQNPEVPCKLEKAENGGQWVEFADLTLCPPNIKIGEGNIPLIFDPVSGEFLPPEKDPDFDPREDYILPETQPNPKCSAAFNAARAIHELHNRTTPYLTGEINATGVAGSLVGLVQIFFGVAVTIALILPIAAAVLAIALSQAVLQFNNTVEYKLRCIISEQLNEDGTLKAGGFNAILTDVFNTSGAIYQLIWYYLQCIGEAGLQNSLRLQGGTSDDCGCATCGEFYEGWDYNQIYPTGCTTFNMSVDGYGFALGRTSTSDPYGAFLGNGRAGAVSVNGGGVNNSRHWAQSNYYYDYWNNNAIRCAELGVRFASECTVTQTSFWYRLSSAMTYKGIFLRFYGDNKVLRHESVMTGVALPDTTWRKFTENKVISGVKYVTFHNWANGTVTAQIDELRINAIGNA